MNALMVLLPTKIFQNLNELLAKSLCSSGIMLTSSERIEGVHLAPI